MNAKKIKDEMDVLYKVRKELIEEIQDLQESYKDSEELEFYCWPVEIELDKIDRKLKVLYDELNSINHEA
jgi:uncharacterized coiled-coil protein SlyX